MGNENLMLAFIESFAPEEEVDEHARKTLSSLLFEFSNREKIVLANVRYVLDDRKYSSIMDILFENNDFESLQICFVKPKINANWEYDAPTVEMNIKKGGTGNIVLASPFDPYSYNRWDMEHLHATEESAMFRVYMLEFFYPESIRSMSLRGDLERKYPFSFDLFLFEDLLKFTKRYGVLPILLRVCAYTKYFRFTYDIDIVNDTLIANFRAGRFPVSARVFRHPKQYYFLDRILATSDIGYNPKKVLETAFETNGVSVYDIANSFGLSERMAEGALEACVKHGFLEKVGKPPRISYIPRFENFGGVIEYTLPHPVYEQTEKKMETEAEERKEEENVCPVCHGRKLPGEIVCEHCARASEILAEEKGSEVGEIAASIFSSAVSREVERESTEGAEISSQPQNENKVAEGTQKVIEKTEGKAMCRCPSCGFHAKGSICISCGYALLNKNL
ncbi:MAG: hypothetical protein ACPL1Y_05840 [Thermoplasmata archaeon]